MPGVGSKLGSLDVLMSDAPNPLRWIGQGLLRLVLVPKPLKRQGIGTFAALVHYVGAAH